MKEILERIVETYREFYKFIENTPFNFENQKGVTGYIKFRQRINKLESELSSLQSLKETEEKESVNIESVLLELSHYNPYPESVFTPVKATELKKIIKLLKDNGYSPDCLYGNWGRKVWDNCVKKATELFLEYALQSPAEPLTELRKELIKLLKNEQVQFTYGIESEEDIVDKYLTSNPK